MNIALRHPLLPHDLSELLLKEWIKKNAFQKFTDTIRRYYTPEEIAEFEKESCANSRTINALRDLLQSVRDAVVKGTEQEIKVVIPVNLGTKQYEEFRRQNDDLVDQGFENIETEVYGIVNTINDVMLFFTLEGQEIEERARPLSETEKRQYNELLLSAHLNSEEKEANDDDTPTLFIDENMGLKVGKSARKSEDDKDKKEEDGLEKF